MVEVREVHSLLVFANLLSGKPELSERDHMPIVFMIVALCAGLTCSLVWMSLGGSGLMAFIVYVLTGHLLGAALLGRAALRNLQ